MAHSIITHNNKEVLFINHRGLVGDDLFDSIKSATQYLLEQKKEYLTVSDFTDTTGTQKINQYLQSQEMKEASKYQKKLAVVGMTGIKKMVLKVYNVFTGVPSKTCDTLDEALEYVTKP